MDAAQRLMFPVGQYGGEVRDDTDGVTSFAIRRGWTVLSIDARSALLWRDAHGRLEDLGATVWTMAAILDRRADFFTLHQRRESYAVLVAFDMLAAVDPDDPDDAERFARAHRLQPLVHGMGNAAEDPSRFAVGYPPDHVAGLPWDLWRIWHGGHLEPTLWDACLATDHPQPHRLLSDLLHSLHTLLTLRLAYLDTVREPDAPTAEPDPPEVYSPYTAEDLLFAPGHDLGPYHPGPNEPASHFEVGLGRARHTLPTQDDHRLWIFGHGVGSRPPMTWPRYRRAVEALSIPRIDLACGRLTDRGLLHRVPAGGDGAVTFARNHRLLPLSIAVGNTEEDSPPGTYKLGGVGSRVHHASELEYWLWTRCAQYDNLWQACDTLARLDLGARVGGGDPRACVLPLLLAAQGLISSLLAFLDVAWDRR